MYVFYQMLLRSFEDYANGIEGDTESVVNGVTKFYSAFALSATHLGVDVKAIVGERSKLLKAYLRGKPVLPQIKSAVNVDRRLVQKALESVSKGLDLESLKYQARTSAKHYNTTIAYSI